MERAAAWKIVDDVLETQGYNTYVSSTTLLDLGMDSLEMVELFTKLEDKLNVVFSSEQAMNIKTVYDIVQLVEGYE